MIGWREGRKKLIAAYVAYAKEHPRKPTPRYQKVIVWVMVVASLVAWLYMHCHR